jgi:hypothetical protein
MFHVFLFFKHCEEKNASHGIQPRMEDTYLCSRVEATTRGDEPDHILPPAPLKGIEKTIYEYTDNCTEYL